MTVSDLSRTLQTLTSSTQDARLTSSGRIQVRGSGGDRWVTLGRRWDSPEGVLNEARAVGVLPS